MATKKSKKNKYVADSFANQMANLGLGSSSKLEGTQYLRTRLTKNFNLLTTLYRNSWITKRIINTVATDMTKNGIKINSDLKPEELDKITRAIGRTKLQSQLKEAVSWGRLYGGAGAIILLKGQDDILDKPIDYDAILPGDYAGLLVFDRWSGIYPLNGEYVEDIESVDFGLPKYYQVQTDRQGALKVHHSRVLRFIGDELPRWEKTSEMDWGASVMEAVFDELKKRDNTSWNIAQLMFMAHTKVRKIDSLRQIMQQGNEAAQADLYNTLQAQNALLSNTGTQVIDAEDDYNAISYTFSGINDVYECFMMDVCGASGIPMTKLYGRSPAGLNATGDSDLQNYYEMIKEKQEDHLRLPYEKVLPIICMSELGFIPDDLEHDFNPVEVVREDAQADIVGKKTDSIVKALESGIISPRIAGQELKQMSDSTGMFSNLTDEFIETLSEEVQGFNLPDYGNLPDLNPEENNKEET